MGSRQSLPKTCFTVPAEYLVAVTSFLRCGTPNVVPLWWRILVQCGLWNSRFLFLSLYLCVGLCSLPLFLFCLLLIINVVQTWCYDVYADIQVHMCILHCKITRLMQEQNIIYLTNTLLFGLRLWFKKPFLWFHKLQVIVPFHWKVWEGCVAT